MLTLAEVSFQQLYSSPTSPDGCNWLRGSSFPDMTDIVWVLLYTVRRLTRQLCCIGKVNTVSLLNKNDNSFLFQ